MAAGLTAWLRGEDGPDAIAASRIVAETVHMWRQVLKSKFQKQE